MKTLSHLVAFTVAICGLVAVEPSASATAADITGTWEVTLHTPDAGDIPATYGLKQDGEKISGTYHGLKGPGDITGTITGNDVVLTVTVPGQRTGRLSGKLMSATKMSGTVTGWNSNGPMPWSAERKAEGAGTLTIVNQYGGGVYYLTIERGSEGGPFKVRASSRAEPVKRVEEGKMYGTTVLIEEGGSKSYFLEAGSYYVSLTFHKSGRGVYTMTEPPIVITAGHMRTLHITADGKLKY
jgi:hypothetical protein